MTRFALPFLLIAGLALAGAAPQHHRPPRAQAEFDGMLAGLAPGAPQHCVRRDRVTEIRPFGNIVIFREGRGRAWRNSLDGHCAGLEQGDTLIVQSVGARYCGGDPVRSRAPVGGHLTGICRLGEFVPYTK